MAGDVGAQLSRDELFVGWRLFFDRLAADAPVVLVVEDAQHGDAGFVLTCQSLPVTDELTVDYDA